jgi:hypothetical protein
MEKKWTKTAHLKKNQSNVGGIALLDFKTLYSYSNPDFLVLF